jgi:6-phosphofructokinase 1
MRVKGNVLIAEAGGPTAVIDSSLYGLLNEAKNHHEIEEIFGALYGIDGILTGKIIDLRKENDRTLQMIEHFRLSVGLQGLLLVDVAPALCRMTLMTGM